ncbi:MAG: flagellar basal body-associated FliL family protein [Clostridiaceae bacterium]|nr:flagellar basal body-associated FliL family protein [Clostridiaceae bacterium]
MGGKSSFFVLIGIVAFLSLSLALLAGYVFLVQDRDPNNTKSITETVKVPKDDEIVKSLLFEDKLPFNLKSNNPDKISVIVVSVEVWYYKKAEGIKDSTLKVEGNKSKLQEIVGTYFQELSIEQVMTPSAKEDARKELTKRMNEFLTSNEWSKRDIVYTVVFDQWFYQ